MNPNQKPGKPDSSITAKLQDVAELYAEQLRHDRWRSRYGVDLREWSHPPESVWEVEKVTDAGMLAGAQTGDLAVLCEVLDRYEDHDATVKSHENFRGVYSSRSEPKVRCYYFAPLD